MIIVLLSFNYCTLHDAAIYAGPSNYESLHCLTSFGGFQRVSLNIKEWKCILSFFTVYPDLHRYCFCSQFVPNLRSWLQRWLCNFSFRNSHVAIKCKANFMQVFFFPKCSFKAISWPCFISQRRLLGQKQKNVQWRFTCTWRSVMCVVNVMPFNYRQQ